MKLPRKQKQTGLVINGLTCNYSVGGEKPLGSRKDMLVMEFCRHLVIGQMD